MNRLIRTLVPRVYVSTNATLLQWSSRSLVWPSLLLQKNLATTTSEAKLNDKPVAYTKSKAFRYKASESFRVTEEEMTYPNYTSTVVKFSLAIFLIYFCILREPNDVDEMLSRDLFDIVPDLEIPTMESDINRFKTLGISTEELENKLTELKQLQSNEKK